MTKPYAPPKPHPDTEMMNHGYKPETSQGAVKPPIFMSSTFLFPTAEDGKDFFDYLSGRKTPPEDKKNGLVYSRFNNPNSEITEKRLALYENAEDALIFSSGMGALTSVFMTYLRPHDVILHSQPLYGGTDTLIGKVMGNLAIQREGFPDGCDKKSLSRAIEKALEKGRISLILIETPANPTNNLVDIALIRELSEEIAQKQNNHRPLIVCDNTLLGPVFQKPLEHGADISLYSLTKYVGGHSDIIAGAVIGAHEVIQPIRLIRGTIGTHLDPHSAWLISRSLETLGLRMERAASNAKRICTFLRHHPKIEKIYFPEFLSDNSPEKKVYQKQCTGAGSTFAIDIKGGLETAFKFLNKLTLFKLAVSLGGTESLICHPGTTTHSGIPTEVREKIGITDATIRLSIGIEYEEDLIADLSQALEDL